MHSLAIIIPAYKPTYLRETLESIANQTDKNFHLYIGDDCSPYDLKSIVDEFNDRIPLTYHRFESNLGGRDLVAQWERCIGLSEDESFIWLFSDDDTMSEDCVRNINSYIEKNPSHDVFRINVNVIDAESRHLRKVKFPQEISAKDLYIGKLNGSLECFVVEYIFSRKIYETSGKFVKFALAWGSDLATWVNMAKDKGILSLTDGAVNWRSSGINISTTQTPTILKRKADALIEFLLWGENLFGDDPKIRKINTKGLLSRITQMAVQSDRTIGIAPLKKYSVSKTDKFNLMVKYNIIYFLKKLHHVF